METNCVTVREHLAELKEGRLEPPVKTAVEQHLHYCEECILKWALLRVDPRDLCRV